MPTKPEWCRLAAAFALLATQAPVAKGESGVACQHIRRQNMTRANVYRFCAKAPLALSIIACVWVLGNVAGGAHSGGDEGTGFKVFWLLIGIQIPFLAGFALAADWRHFRPVTGRAALLVAGLVVAFAPVAYFHL